MAEPTIGLLHAVPGLRSGPAVRFSATISDYWALTKPEVNLLILITTFAGFYLAPVSADTKFRVFLIARALLGTFLVAGGTAALNQFLERSFDAQMRRTARRPLASGRLESSNVLYFGIILSLAGAVYLALAVNLLTSFLAVITLLSYLFLYTPLKRRTPLCTLVGAFPGAMPPLIGWAAAHDSLDLRAWVFFGIVFLWQFPHFMAIAWMYREDYARAGYLVLPFGKSRERFVIWQSAAVAVALIPVSLLPRVNHSVGLFYCVGASILGAIFFCYSVRFALRRSSVAARKLLFASIVYLPLVFILMMLDKR